MVNNSHDEWLALQDAVAAYRAVAGYASAYATYRKHAADSGSVFLGQSIHAKKDGRGRWVVRQDELDAGLQAERDRAERIKFATREYRNHVLIGSEGEQVQTEWGHYVRRGSFHFHYDAIMAGRKRSDGTWVCSACWQPTTDEHEREECHTCADWGSCGRDCTLSAVRCDTCGTRMEV